MLGRLIKYEFKAGSRMFLLLYAALLLVSIINSILTYVGGGINQDNLVMSSIQSIFMVGYVILIIAVAIATLVLIIMRFYKNLLGDEGYLMFTLPVSTDSQILSKLITSIIWTVLSALVMIISIFVITAKYDSPQAVLNFFDRVSSAGVNVPYWVTMAIISFLIYMVTIIMMFYASMAIGSNLTKNRLLGSFLGYVIIYIVSQVIGFVCVGIIYAGGFFSQLGYYDAGTMPIERMIEMFDHVGMKLFLYINILNLIMAAVYYLVTRYFLKNRLNLS